MNALVNDQLGRMRLLFGDDRIAGTFKSWSGRPVRFARYTSRTLYPGVRHPQKDQSKLKPIAPAIKDLIKFTMEVAGVKEAAKLDPNSYVGQLEVSIRFIFSQLNSVEAAIKGSAFGSRGTLALEDPLVSRTDTTFIDIKNKMDLVDSVLERITKIAKKIESASKTAEKTLDKAA